MSMDDKKYTINGKLASAREIIQEARDLDDSFGRDGILSTSEAASILRQHGMTVGNKEAE